MKIVGGSSSLSGIDDGLSVATTSARMPIWPSNVRTISFASGGRITRHLEGPRLRTLLQQAMEPWRSEDEAAELEADEQRHQEALDEIASARRGEAAKSRGESFQEGTTL